MTTRTFTDITAAITAFERIIASLDVHSPDPHGQAMDAFVDLVELRAALPDTGDDWAELRRKIDSARDLLRRAMTDGALKDMESRTQLLRDIAHRLRIMVSDLRIE